MDRITTEKVMDKLDIFQYRFGKIDGFGLWYLEIISVDAGTQYTSTEFLEECQTRGVHLTLATLDNQEMNRQVKVICITLRTIAQSIMEHARVSEAYIYFALIYTEDHISRYFQSNT